MKNSWRTRLFILGFCLAGMAPAHAAPNVSPVTFGLAIERGDVSQARRWLDEGLPVDFVGDRVGTGLMIAAWEGNVPMMALFVERGAGSAACAMPKAAAVIRVMALQRAVNSLSDI